MCVSRDRSVDSMFLSSPQRLTVSFACEFVSIEIRVGVQHEKVSIGDTVN